jgi:Ca-activated chloride channel family protein
MREAVGTLSPTGGEGGVRGQPHGVPDQPVAGTLWARRRVDDLLAPRLAPPDAAAVEEVIAHALRFKLVTPHTSFVAVERELRVDPKLPLARVLVPNELPDGVSHAGVFGEAIEVLPARVKPGDPELRVKAAATAVAVRVALPFERAEREAIRDESRGDWVLRFLVPPAWPDGSWDATVRILHADGRVEERAAPIRVDTTPSAVAVLAAPAAAARGEELRLVVKPALPLGRLASLNGREGGLASAVKGAMEVKEVLVRAPWGEVARARIEGPLGVWVASLRVPHDAREGEGELELVASDAAGNVSRRRVPLQVRAGPVEERTVAYASAVGGAAVFAAVTVVALLAAVLLRRRRAPRPLGRVLLAAAVKDARERTR